jgi:hypothetical protein
MIRLHHLMKHLAVLSFATVVSACQPQNTTPVEFDDNSMRLSPPAELTNARNVNKNALSPSVYLNDGTVIPMSNNGTEGWSGQIMVPANSNYRITIEWREALPQRSLVLAVLNRDVFVGPDGEVVDNVISSEYSTNIDDDSDSFSNLQEREALTDPFSFDSIPSDSPSVPVIPSTENPETPTPTEPEPLPVPEPVPAPEPTNPSVPTPPEPEPNEPEPTEPEPTDPAPTPPAPTEPEAPNQFPLIQNPTVVIPKISPFNAPIIDGLGVTALAADGSLLGEWADAVQSDVNGQRLGINRLMVDNDTDESNNAPHRRWAAMHDGTRMYVLVLVDDVGLRFADDNRSIWEDDSLELFIDGDNSKNLTWGDDDDFQFLMALLKINGQANKDGGGNSRVQSGDQSSQTDIDLKLATGPGIGPDGIRLARWEQDVYELSFDMAAAGIFAGQPFGFELQVNDDDNGDGREAKWGWFHPARTTSNTDTTFINPSIMGTIELGD